MNKTIFKLNKGNMVEESAAANELARRFNCLEEGQALKVTLEPYKENRSLAQNRLMWMWYDVIRKAWHESGDKLFESEVWHIQFCRILLGQEWITLPNGQMEQRTRGTRHLNTAEMSEYLTVLDAYVGSEMDIILPHPEELFFEAMGRSK